MRDNFPVCLSLVLKAEGGYVDNPHDPGGATNKGITQAVYAAWRRSQKLPAGTVKFIAAAEVEAIYRKQYWDAVHGDALGPGVDYCVFDEAVNSGVGQATQDLQATLGAVPDGHLGIVSLDLAAHAVDRLVIGSLCDRRLTFLHQLKTWTVFGKGWNNRIAAVRAAALKMAA